MHEPRSTQHRPWLAQVVSTPPAANVSAATPPNRQPLRKRPLIYVGVNHYRW